MKQLDRRAFLHLPAAVAAGIVLSKRAGAQTLPPSLTCVGASPSTVDLRVTASNGDIDGFTIEWIELESYIDPGFINYNWQPGDGCSFTVDQTIASGNSFVVTVPPNTLNADGSEGCLGAELSCDEAYVFRVAAKGSSVFSEPICCRTLPCGDHGGGAGCTYTIGYWMTHGPEPTGNNQNEWPVTSLVLGNVSYSDLQALSILKQAPRGNGLVILARQLIGVKLNIANGADPSAVADVVAAADALIGSLVVPPIGTGKLSPAQVSSLNETLTQYNEGLIGPGHCDNVDGGSGSSPSPTGCAIPPQQEPER